ncbi:MAG: alpha/beta hydrolase [Oscillospiraceae bacterium]|jgi:acetyl esterase/lipase|nr:alpha/beta hydrolase [Oscillospiraceae bacterium]
MIGILRKTLTVIVALLALICSFGAKPAWDCVGEAFAYAVHSPWTNLFSAKEWEDINAINPELRTIGVLWRWFMPDTTWPFFYLRQLFAVRGTCSSDLLDYEEIYIPREDGSRLRIAKYAPKEKEENVPALLWIHGGGYANSTPENEEAFIEAIIQAVGCVVLSPDYTLSTEKPYPAALEDCYSALQWLQAHAAAYGARSDQLFVGGESAGGGMTAALTLYARDKGEINVAYQMPLYPMIDDRPTASNTGNTHAIWNSASNDHAWNLYLNGRKGAADIPIYAAPARAADYTNLPPTCTYVGSIEAFHDETVTYVENLRAAGVHVDFRVFEGAYHAFDIVQPEAAISKQARAFFMDSLRYAAGHYFAAQP